MTAERVPIKPIAVVAALLGAVVAGALMPVGAAHGYSERSIGTPEQVAWVRHAADRFVSAELAANASEACAVLNAPLRATIHGRSCEQRWNEWLARLLHEPGMRARLRAERRAVASARVVVAGDVASIELPDALLGGPNRFRWTENCWMLES
jgi:hypothetical protein